MPPFPRLLSTAAALVLAATAGRAAPPNVLVITADDLGNQLSCYGETRIKTPCLDALAAEGARFARAYVAQSSCSPSRAALLSGLYPHQNGQYGLAHLGFTMHPGQKTMPALMKAAGYRTGVIGKLHVEPEADMGFEFSAMVKNLNESRHVRKVSDQAKAFFAAGKGEKKPFFLYANYYDPHGPYTPDLRQVAGLPADPVDPATVEPYPQIGGANPDAKKANTALVYDCISRVDTGVGMLLDELKAAGHADDTLVIFLGDNGAVVRKGKTTGYEPGVQVPLIVRWPGKVKPGQTREELVSLVDVMPTVLTAAGTTVPDGLAGRPLQPLFDGTPAPPWREFLFTEMHFHTANYFHPGRTVRDDRFKLMLNLAPEGKQPAVELYDLKEDPGETKNRAADPDMASQRKRLEAALQKWREETNDPLLDPARLKRWTTAAAKWKDSAPRYKTKVAGGNENAAMVPPGGLEELK